MFIRKMFPALMILLFVSPIHAQSPDGTDPTANRPPPNSELLRTHMPLIQKRLQFINEAYKLDKKQIPGLLQSWTALVPDHDAYMKQHEQTLRLRPASLRIIRKNKNISEKILARVISKFENEIYEIHENAPLSLTMLVKMVEKDLTPEQVSKGRSAIRATFAAKLKDKQFMIDKLDRLAIGPIGMPDPEPTFEQRERELKQRIKDDQLARAQRQREQTTPNPQTNPPPRRSPTNPPAKTSPKPLPPAPVVTEWPKSLETTASKYKFSEEQIKAAQRVLRSCVTRAETHLKQKKADYENADKLTGADEKKQRIRALNKPLDKLFDELTQRVESIASIEQKQGFVKTASQKDSKVQ